MPRILLMLASISLTLLVAAVVAGFSVGNLYARPDETTLRWATIHRLTGTAAALGVVFVECVVVTYFIGTSRWCKEVVETYRLDAGPVARSKRLKRRAFAVALVGMLGVVGVIALGAASDPATGRANTAAWTDYHLVAALGGVAMIAWTYFAAWQSIEQHQQILDTVVAEVGRVRRQRGLDSPEAAPGEPSRSAVGRPDPI